MNDQSTRQKDVSKRDRSICSAISKQVAHFTRFGWQTGGKATILRCNTPFKSLFYALKTTYSLNMERADSKSVITLW